MNILKFGPCEGYRHTYEELASLLTAQLEYKSTYAHDFNYHDEMRKIFCYCLPLDIKNEILEYGRYFTTEQLMQLLYETKPKEFIKKAATYIAEIRRNEISFEIIRTEKKFSSRIIEVIEPTGQLSWNFASN